MGDGLPALHDPNNSRLRLEIAICSDPLMGLLIFLFRLFGLDLIDLDAVPWVDEVEIRGKSVVFADILTSRFFAKNAVLSAGKGLEGSFELSVVCGLLAGPPEGTHVTQDLGLGTYQGPRKLLNRGMT